MLTNQNPGVAYTPTQTPLRSGLRVAIVHHWFIRRGGGERVVERLAELFPRADLYSPLAAKSALGPALQSRPLHQSFIRHIPGARRLHRLLLPLYPLALEQFDLRGYDLVISSESGPAKGVLTSSRTCHICYCHTPMRYLWDMYQDYRDKIPLGPIGRGAFAFGAHYLRQWDRAAADRVDYFLASSHNSASRIRKCYRRDAQVVYPPVDVDKFTASADHDAYYLFVGRLVSYKRADLAVQACNKLARPLRIIGHGEELARLRREAGPTISFLGAPGDDEVRKQLRRCRALLFPGEEDIGITPVEAQACGKPVIAFGRGGALETVRGLAPNGEFTGEQTGVFFNEATPDSLVEAIQRFESMELQFRPEAARRQAERFSVASFRENFLQAVHSCLRDFTSRHGAHCEP